MSIYLAARNQCSRTGVISISIATDFSFLSSFSAIIISSVNWWTIDKQMLQRLTIN